MTIYIEFLDIFEINSLCIEIRHHSVNHDDHHLVYVSIRMTMVRSLSGIQGLDYT